MIIPYKRTMTIINSFVFTITALFVGGTSVASPSAADTLSVPKTHISMTLDDACVLLGYMSLCRVHYHPDKEAAWFIILDLVNNELDSVLKRSKLDLTRVAAYYNLRGGSDDETVRFWAARDLLNIALYRFIYERIAANITYLDPQSEEVLVLKNIPTPRTYAEAHSWLSNYVGISFFSLPLKEHLIAYAKQLTFDESILWLLHGFLVPRGEKMDRVYAYDHVVNDSENGLILLVQAVRNTIEQQESPERKALVRYLLTDQEITNALSNGAVLSKR